MFSWRSSKAIHTPPVSTPVIDRKAEAKTTSFFGYLPSTSWLTTGIKNIYSILPTKSNASTVSDYLKGALNLLPRIGITGRGFTIGGFVFDLRNIPKKLKFLLSLCLVTKVKADINNPSIAYFMDPTKNSTYKLSAFSFAPCDQNNFIETILNSCNATAALSPYPTSFDFLNRVIGSCIAYGEFTGVYTAFYRATGYNRQDLFESCITEAILNTRYASEPPDWVAYLLFGIFIGLPFSCWISYHLYIKCKESCDQKEIARMIREEARVNAERTQRIQDVTEIPPAIVQTISSEYCNEAFYDSASAPARNDEKSPSLTKRDWLVVRSLGLPAAYQDIEMSGYNGENLNYRSTTDRRSLRSPSPTMHEASDAGAAATRVFPPSVPFLADRAIDVDDDSDNKDQEPISDPNEWSFALDPQAWGEEDGIQSPHATSPAAIVYTEHSPLLGSKDDKHKDQRDLREKRIDHFARRGLVSAGNAHHRAAEVGAGAAAATSTATTTRPLQLL
jgi:hypothetical protein